MQRLSYLGVIIMDKYSKYSYMLRNIVLGTIFINIISRYKDTPKPMLIYLGIFIFILTNDYIRHNFLSRKRNFQRYKVSLLISIVTGSALAFVARGYTDAYMFIVMYEIIMYLRGRTRILFFTLHILCFFYASIFNDISIQMVFNKDFWLENGIDLLMSIFLIAFFALLIYFLEYQARERRKTENLNRELHESYAKLQEYSRKVGDLAITKERNRVAQEIHDSLGHIMTALIMNLDYMEKIVDKEPDKIKELIIKAQELARNSMTEVRNAVFTLKEGKPTTGLLASVSKLIEDLTVGQEVSIKLDTQGDMEGLSPDISNILFRTVQEALTNGVKHGNATEILIYIERMNDYIKLQVKDNGTGCTEISKGNGLKGIEERIHSVKGIVRLESVCNKGFIIDISIPIFETGRDIVNG